MTVQRYRVVFEKGERVRYISHLDVLRFWERAIRRAELPLAYSQGFTPHPKLAFASPLPLGFIGEAEIMDVTLDEVTSAEKFAADMASQSTPDIHMIRAHEVSATGPAPQAVILWADYAVDLPDIAEGEATERIGEFLAAEQWLWTEDRKEKEKTYDLRAATASASASATAGGSRLSMRLQADSILTARPEQLVAALFPSAAVGIYARTGLVLDEPSPAKDAWRRRGRFEQWP